jgi:hypothetical protein
MGSHAVARHRRDLLLRLLGDHRPITAEAWLSARPQIEVVARDRAGGYALTAAKALPRVRLRRSSGVGSSVWEVEMGRDPEVREVAECLMAQHRDDALQIAFDEARERAARHDQSYKSWLQVADCVRLTLDSARAVSE